MWMALLALVGTAQAGKKHEAERTRLHDEMLSLSERNAWKGVDRAYVRIRDLREAGVTRLIHGHTHRPAMHELELDGLSARRIVLGDWYEQGSVLECTATGCTLQALPVDQG